jgi:GlcNAc-P-P-Und epimerase
LLRYLEARRYFHVGDAAVRKSFSYIGNAVSQVVALLSAPTSKVHQQTFYVADYEPIILRSWCDDLARALGVSPAPVVHAGLARLLARGGDVLASTIAPKFKFTTFRLRNIMTPYVFDTSNLQAITGPLPFDAHTAIEQTVKWYREVARSSPLHAA